MAEIRPHYKFGENRYMCLSCRPQTDIIPTTIIFRLRRPQNGNICKNLDIDVRKNKLRASTFTL